MDGVKINRNKISINELEKHLSDYKKKKAENSKDIAEKIPLAKHSSAIELSNINPDLSLKYSLYSTALGYSSNARYIKNIGDTLPHIQKLFA